MFTSRRSTRLCMILLVCLLTFVYWPPSSASAQAETIGTGVSTASSLIVRSKPTTSSAKLGSIPRGTKVAVYAREGSWYRIAFNSGDGFVSSNYITFTPGATTPEPESQPPASDATKRATVKTAGGALNIRRGPSASHAVVMKLALGTALEVHGESGGWYHISHKGTYGYASKSYIVITPQNVPLQGGDDAADEDSDAPEGGSQDDGGAGESTTGLGVVATKSGALNIRRGPSSSYAVVMKLAKGTTLDIMGESGGWYYIRHKGTYGYASKSYITITQRGTSPQDGGGAPEGGTNEDTDDDDDGIDDSAPIAVGVVATKSGALNIRRGASSSYAVVMRLAKGTTLDIMGESGGWFYICYEGAYGYASKSYINILTDTRNTDDGNGGGEEPPEISAIKGTVRKLNWFGEGGVRDIWERGTHFTMIDVRTFTVLRMKYWRGTNHADIETATKADTALLKQCYGGRWSWSRRPVWVIINGQAYAGSINGMPHSNESIRDNGMDGQICLHFTGSKTHNTCAVCSLHKETIEEAYNAGK